VDPTAGIQGWYDEKTRQWGKGEYKQKLCKMDQGDMVYLIDD